MPPIVLISTGKKALMNTMNTFDHMPMPNQIRTSGTSATRGVEYSAVRNGSKTIASRRYQPMTTPQHDARRRWPGPTPMMKLVPL